MSKKLILVCVLLFLLVTGGGIDSNLLSHPPDNKKLLQVFNPSTKLNLTKEANVLVDSRTVSVIKPIPDPIVQKAVRRDLVARGSRSSSPSYADAEVTKLYRDNTNNCTKWAKEKAGVEGSIGNGGRSGRIQQTPTVGSIGVQSKIIHSFIVVDIKDTGVIVNESNWIKGWITQRFVPYTDIMGFIQ